MEKKVYRPVILAVLDGWGLGEKRKGNAITAAKLPNIEKLDRYYPRIALQASGISVGLPWGEPGNSEVGHMTLGTGKVIYQNMPRITMSIQSGEFFRNEAFLSAMEHARKNNSALHFMGLLGKGGIHSNAEHLYALLEMARDQKIEKVFIHIFTDGRDSPPTSGIESIKELQKKIESFGVGKIATLGGRYYGMDRNDNWDRVEKAYLTMTEGKGEETEDPAEYLRKSYSKEVTDEYIVPAVVFEKGKPVGQVADGDALIFFNFREDRARQITKAFALPGFSKFQRKEIRDLFFVAMVQYEDSLPVEVAFPPIEVKECVGQILSQNKKSQLRIAETEKFAHVTYFFNGGNEEPFPLEERVIIPSKDVPSFDQAPEMSAKEITEKIVESVEEEKYDFILVNFANPDIVGHTGNEKATIKAVETVDYCLGEIIKKTLLKGGCLLITADHGNAEETLNNRTGQIDTEHSANPVPLWFVTPENHREKPLEESPVRVGGLLSDIAPTVLELMGLEKSPEMTGESLLEILE